MFKFDLQWLFIRSSRTKFRSFLCFAFLCCTRICSFLYRYCFLHSSFSLFPGTSNSVEITKRGSWFLRMFFENRFHKDVNICNYMCLWLPSLSGTMFTFINPVEHYIKEIRVPCKLEPSERATTTLPFVFESQTSSRVQSPRDPEVSAATPLLFPPTRRNIPPVKRQLHRELVYYFGRNKEV